MGCHQRPLQRRIGSSQQRFQFFDNLRLAVQAQPVSFNHPLQGKFRKGFRLLDDASDPLRPVLPNVGVGVFPDRQQRHPAADPLGEKQRDGTFRRLDAGLVTVEKQHDLIGKPFQQADLISGQRRSQRSDHRLVAVGHQRQQIEISLHQRCPTLTSNRIPLLIKAEEQATLRIDIAFRRVEIFRVAVTENSPTETGDPTFTVKNRADNPIPETIIAAALLPGPEQADCQGGLLLVLIELSPEKVPARLFDGRGITQLVAFLDLFADTTLLQIPASRRTSR